MGSVCLIPGIAAGESIPPLRDSHLLFAFLSDPCVPAVAADEHVHARPPRARAGAHVAGLVAIAG